MTRTLLLSMLLVFAHCAPSAQAAPALTLEQASQSFERCALRGFKANRNVTQILHSICNKQLAEYMKSLPSEYHARVLPKIKQALQEKAKQQAGVSK